MKFPSDLIQKVHYDYVGAKHKDGMFTFNSLDDETIEVIIKSFLEWAEKSGIIVENTIDIETIKKW